MTRLQVRFRSGQDLCSAWHFTSGEAGRPIVVMAHGFGSTKDSRLAPFAERFVSAGLDVLAFDYRGFGDSEGTPRQSLSVARPRGHPWFDKAVADQIAFLARVLSTASSPGRPGSLRP